MVPLILVVQDITLTVSRLLNSTAIVSLVQTHTRTHTHAILSRIHTQAHHTDNARVLISLQTSFAAHIKDSGEKR